MKRLLKPMVLIVGLMLPMVACKDNSTGPDDGMEEPEPATLTVQDQGTSNGNQVVIPSAMINESGWVVIHRSNSNGDGPMVPDIIGKAMLDAGSNSDVTIQLEESVSDGEMLWAMLHQDTGTDGEYEFTGADSPDQPVTVDGNILTKSFMINQTNPAVMSEDQLNKGGVFTASVDAAEDGWIVIHRSNANGDGPQVPEIIAKAQVSAGSNSNVEIPLSDGESVEAGETLYPMLHYDTGADGEYEFTGSESPDQPVIFDGNIVLSSFVVQENQSTITAMDQTVMDNSIMVDVDADAEGWVVVHRTNEAGNGPQVPQIIGKTKITEGMNEDVMISFGDSVVSNGEQLWPMVHFDTGTMDEYEFEGAGTPDQPMIVEGNIVMESITVAGSEPSVVANSQPADGDIAIEEANAMERGFVVIHRNTQNNGSDAPDVTGIIGKADIYTGTNGDLTIDLEDGESVESGETLWAMLHIDSNNNGTYDFDVNDENPLDPPVIDETTNNIVMVKFTVE